MKTPSNNSIVLENKNFRATLGTGQVPGVTGLQSGNDAHRFTEKPLTLRLAATTRQVDISYWLYQMGSGTPVAPEQEAGFLAGFHKPDQSMKGWPGSQRLNQYPVGQPSVQAVEYPGYCWFRRHIPLPADWKGEAVQFGLGGYDRCDWRSYRVFVNGQLIGTASHGGEWHEAGLYRLAPGDANYGCLKFGEENSIAVQACGMDRRDPRMPRLDLERFSENSLMADQFICAGEPWRDVSDFILTEERHDGTSAEFELVNEAEGLKATARYWIEGEETALHKQVTVRNTGKKTVVLLEMDVMGLVMDAVVDAGGMGTPCLIGENWFGGVSHPAGVARGEKGQVRLQVLPGVTLAPGESYASKVAVIGAGPGGKSNQSFVKYLQGRMRRKPAFLNLYSLYGLCEIASIVDPPIELTETLVLRSCDDIERLRTKGVQFDYYCIDTGWNDPAGDWKQFYGKYFPNGPEKVFRRIAELGIKTLLWMCPSSGPSVFREREGFKPTLPSGCPACREARDLLREGMLYHVRQNGVNGFKLDGIDFYCSQPGHGHLAGKYGVEKVVDEFIRTLDAVKAESKDLLLMLYWGFASPWWLMHGDTLFQRTVCMEGATPSDVPSRKLRQSVTISLDQAHHYNWDGMPLLGQDSLGVWLSRTRWGSWMGKADWQDAWVMDFARGNAMSQLWGDLGVLESEDEDFFGTMSRWTTANGDLLLDVKRILGSAWIQEPYGYTATDGKRAGVFVYNAQFRVETVRLRVDESLGLKPFTGTIRLEALHPQTKKGTRKVVWQEEIELRMEPFEVRMLMLEPGEVAGPSTAEPASRTRLVELKCIFEPVKNEKPDLSDDVKLALMGRGCCYIPNPRDYSETGTQRDERDRQLMSRIGRGKVMLPALPNGGTLLVTAQASRDGIAWHHHGMFKVVQLRATVGGQVLTMATTPHRWHEQAGAWSWILFEGKLAATERLEEAVLELETLLPQDVTVETKVRVEVEG